MYYTYPYLKAFNQMILARSNKSNSVINQV